MLAALAVDLLERFRIRFSFGNQAVVNSKGRFIDESLNGLFRVVAHADFLSLIQEHNTRQEEIGDRKHLFAVAVLVLRHQEPVDDARFVMVFEEVAEHAAAIHDFLRRKKLIAIIVKQRHGIAPFRVTHIVEGVTKIENGRETAVFPNHILHILRSHVIVLSDRQRIGRRKGALLHFTQDIRKTVYIVEILERHIVLVRSIRRKVGVLIILFQMADRIKTESAKSQIHPF